MRKDVWAAYLGGLSFIMSGMSTADQIFKKNIQDILQNGVWDTDYPVRPHWGDGTPAHTIKKFGIVNEYDLQKELPILTIRKTNFENCLDELLWIWQKKSNNVHDLHSHIWDSWADENGSIGKAYGYQLAKKSIYPEGEFDQVDRVLFDLKNNPHSRRILTNIYNFDDLHEMHLYPCAYSMTFNVSGDRLNGILNQRSNDMLTANNWNVLQYSLLIMMFAQVSGLKPGKLIHVIADAHLYDRHIDLVKEVIAKPEHPAPRLFINPNIKDFYEFKIDDFQLIDYEFEKLGKKIPVAI